MRKGLSLATMIVGASVLYGCAGNYGSRAQTNTLSMQSGNVTLRTPSVATDYISIKGRPYLAVRTTPGKTASKINDSKVMMDVKLIPGDNYNETTSSKTGLHIVTQNDEVYFLPNAFMGKMDGKNTLIVNNGEPVKSLRLLISHENLEEKVTSHRTPMTFTEIVESGKYNIQKVHIKDDEGMPIETVYAIPTDTSQVPNSQPLAFIRTKDGLPEVITDRTHRLVDGKKVTETKVYIKDIAYIPFRDTEVSVIPSLPDSTIIQMPLALPTPEPIKKD